MILAVVILISGLLFSYVFYYEYDQQKYVKVTCLSFFLSFLSSSYTCFKVLKQAFFMWNTYGYVPRDFPFVFFEFVTGSSMFLFAFCINLYFIFMKSNDPDLEKEMLNLSMFVLFLAVFLMFTHDMFYKNLNLNVLSNHKKAFLIWIACKYFPRKFVFVFLGIMVCTSILFLSFCVDL